MHITEQMQTLVGLKELENISISDAFDSATLDFIKEVIYDLELQNVDIEIYYSTHLGTLSGAVQVHDTYYKVLIKPIKRGLRNTLAHELRHVWQYETDEDYGTDDEKAKEATVTDRYNLKEIHTDMDEYIKYYWSIEEIDARSYAERFVRKYRRIMKRVSK